MASRNIGTLTIDVLARTQNLTQGMSKAAREVENESRRIKRSLEREVSSGAESATQSLNRFSAQVISIAAAWRGLSTAIGAADTWASLNNRLKVVTDGQEAFVQAQENVLRISKESRQPLEATAELYQRIAQNQDALGLSGQQVADVVETISKAMATSGASAEAARGALIQLGQAFASGTLRGQELNSVLEQAPALARAIADGLGVQVGKLRELSQAGQLSADAVIKALNSQADAIAQTFSQMDVTIGQAMTNVRTNLIQVIGQFSDATGAASALASSIVLIGNNIPQVASAFAAFASVKITQQLADRVRIFRETQAQLVSQAKLELANAQAIELSARSKLLDAQADVARARAIGGSVSVSAQAAQATLAHRQAVVALEQAQLRAAAAASVFGRAAKSALAFFGGPAGLAVMVAATAGSWLLFRDNTNAAERALIDFNGAMGETVKKFSELSRQQQASEILRLQKDIAAGYGEIQKSIDELTSTAFANLGADQAAEYRKQVLDLSRQLQSGKISADEFSNSLEQANNKLLDGSPSASRLNDKFVEQSGRLSTLARDYQGQNGLLNEFSGAQNRAAGATAGNTQAIRDQEAALAAGQKALTEYIGKMDQIINQGVVSLVRKTRGEFAAIQVEVGQMINSAGGVDKLTPEQRSAINEFLSARKRQIESEEAYDRARKGARKSAVQAVRDADQLAKATERMARMQRDWTTELAGTGNQVMDDYARRLDDIKDRVDEFTRIGLPAERIAEFSSQMQKLAESIRSKDMAEFQQEFNWETQSLMNSLAGVSNATIEYERALYELDKQLKSGIITEQDYQDRLKAIQEQRSSDAQTLIRDMQFELELLRMTNVEREYAIRTRGMEAESLKQYGEQIRDLIKQTEEQYKQTQFIDGLRDEFKGFFSDVLQGNKSIKDSFKDMLEGIGNMIANRIAQNWVDQLFGQSGQMGGGQFGGWLNTFSSWLSGGRANGGWANANSIYEINERGIEMATVRGRDYLLTGNSPVQITPNERLGMGGARTTVVNMTLQGKVDRRTESQIAREVSIQQRIAARNN